VQRGTGGRRAADKGREGQARRDGENDRAGPRKVAPLRLRSPPHSQSFKAGQTRSDRDPSKAGGDRWCVSLSLAFSFRRRHCVLGCPQTRLAVSGRL
jgi:hypothetical protein